MLRVRQIALIASLIFAGSPSIAQEAPVVHIVMFYSSSCIHCQQVIQEVLPPLREEFRDQLDILLLDVANPQMAALFETACEVYVIEESLCGSVPAVIITPHIMIGSDKVTDQLPGLIRAGLAAGGIPLPDIPGMQAAYEYIQSFRSAQPDGAEPVVDPAGQPSAGLWERLSAAPLENGLMLLTLGLLIGSPLLLWRRYPGHLSPASEIPRFYLGGLLLLSILTMLIFLSLLNLSDLPALGNAIAAANAAILLGIGGLLILSTHDPNSARHRLMTLGLPAIVIGGLLLSGYMFFIEITRHDPFCGPIGDCLRVQQSQYAWLFGWLPVGGLGMAGYLTMLAGWLVSRVSTGKTHNAAGAILAVLICFGVLFSAYLTFVELVVIRAMCAWCLTSALLMLLLFWIYWPIGRGRDTPRRHPTTAP